MACISVLRLNVSEAQKIRLNSPLNLTRKVSGKLEYPGKIHESASRMCKKAPAGFEPGTFTWPGTQSNTKYWLCPTFVRSLALSKHSQFCVYETKKGAISRR